MFKLLDIIVEIRDAITLVICILLSLLLIIISDQDPAGPFRSIAFNTIGSIGGYIFNIGAYFRLQDQISELRHENTELAFKNLQMQDALLENIRLRKMLDFKERSSFNLIAAKVIGHNPQGIVNGIILNEGRDRGIEKSDAVICADGLVGKIVEVEKNYAICQILLDPNSRVSAKIQRNREFGIIAWDGGSNFKLLYIAKNINVMVGDVIVTTGYSQIFPDNIKIGVVIDAISDTKGLFQEITVQPSVNFNQLEEIYILKIRESNAP